MTMMEALDQIRKLVGPKHLVKIEATVRSWPHKKGVYDVEFSVYAYLPMRDTCINLDAQSLAGLVRAVAVICEDEPQEAQTVKVGDEAAF